MLQFLDKRHCFVQISDGFCDLDPKYTKFKISITEKLDLTLTDFNNLLVVIWNIVC